MRYCYTETDKARVSLEISLADLLEILPVLEAAATAEGASHRIRRLHRETRDAALDAARSIQQYAAASIRELGGERD